jgi:hypothetical protein
MMWANGGELWYSQSELAPLTNTHSLTSLLWFNCEWTSIKLIYGFNVWFQLGNPFYEMQVIQNDNKCILEPKWCTDENRLI